MTNQGVGAAPRLLSAPRIMRTYLAWLLPLSTLAACTTAPPQDGRNDSFLGAGGKADTGGITDASPEAPAILRLVNTASVATLEHDVGLADIAAQNIVAYRAGDDGVEGAPNDSDDQTFTTLEQLDAIPFIGPIAFHHLLDYVHAQTWQQQFPAQFAWQLQAVVSGDCVTTLTPSTLPQPTTSGWDTAFELDLGDADGSAVTLSLAGLAVPGKRVAATFAPDGTFTASGFAAYTFNSDNYTSSLAATGHIDPLGAIVLDTWHQVTVETGPNDQPSASFTSTEVCDATGFFRVTFPLH